MDDARGEPEADASAASEAWREVTAGFVDLGNSLRSYFDAAPDDEATGEMQTAWHDFTSAAQRLGRSVTNAFQDEDVQDGAKRVFGNLIDAVGQSVRDAGGTFEWGGSGDSPPPEPEPDSDPDQP